MRQFHAAALGCICPGECSLFITEEFRLDQRMRNRGAGHLDPGAFGATRVGMQQLGKDLLARPALALQQHRNGRFGNPFQLLASRGHRGDCPKITSIGGRSGYRMIQLRAPEACLIPVRKTLFLMQATLQAPRVLQLYEIDGLSHYLKQSTLSKGANRWAR